MMKSFCTKALKKWLLKSKTQQKALSTKMSNSRKCNLHTRQQNFFDFLGIISIRKCLKFTHAKPQENLIKMTTCIKAILSFSQVGANWSNMKTKQIHCTKISQTKVLHNKINSMQLPAKQKKTLGTNPSTLVSHQPMH